MFRCQFFSPRALLCLGLLALAGCRAPQPEAPAPGGAGPAGAQGAFAPPRDDLNREIALKAPAKRVVVIGPGAAETIFALGAGSKVVGRDSAADFPEAVKKIPVVADYRGPFVEASVAARPDLVLLQGETWGRERVEGWQRKIGVPVAALTPTTVTMVQQDADKIAAWLGVAKRNLDIAQYIKSIPETRAFIEVSRSPLWTAGQGTLVSDVVEQGQFKNVAADVTGYKAFSKEALLQRQPDVYIVTGKPSDKARIIAQLKSDAALGGLKCVRRGQVLVVPGDFLLRPGPRLRQGVTALRDAAENPERLSTR